MRRHPLSVVCCAGAEEAVIMNIIITIITNMSIRVRHCAVTGDMSRFQRQVAQRKQVTSRNCLQRTANELE